jgi:hypothetical protein
MRQISPVWQRETPKAGRPCHPGAAETVETPGATLSRVRDTPRTGVLRAHAASITPLSFEPNLKALDGLPHSSQK